MKLTTINLLTIKSLVKNLLFPSDSNGNLPLVLSHKAFIAYFIILSVFAVSPPYLKRLQLSLISSSSFNGSDIVALVNSDRQSNNLGGLNESSILNKIAEKKAEDMLANQYFSHVSPVGKTPWDFLKEGQYKYTAAGENLALDYLTAKDVEDALIASPTHRANILSTLYTEIGVAVAHGNFEDNPTTIVVQYFGNPSKVTVATKKYGDSFTDTAGRTGIVKYDTKTGVLLINPNATKTIETTKVENSVQGTSVNLETIIQEEINNVVNSDTVKDTVTHTSEFVDSKINTTLIGLIIGGLVLIALAMLIIRVGALPLELIFRSTILLVLVGYIITNDSVKTLIPKITPASFSIIQSFEKGK